MAEYEKCSGCQSFCMQGHQLAINGPDGTRKEEENGKWVQWKNIKSYSESIKSSESTIQTDSTLSAQSQKDLIDFIIATYSEGEKCPEKGNIFEDWDNKGKITVDTKATSKTTDTSLAEAKKDIEKGGEIQGKSSTFEGSIIHASHYNNLLQPLINFYSPVSADPNGETPKDKNGNLVQFTITENGPVAGWPADQKTTMVTSGQSDQSEKSLIKASLYNKEGLYAKASKLMYHPYQCNVCNIYEGGEWLEIVDEMWRNLKEDAPSDKGWIYAGHSGTQGFITMRAGGGEVQGARLDCSGCVSAAVTLYSIAVGQGANTACQGTYTTHSMGSDWSDPPKLGFTWFDGNGPWQAGDIQVCIAQHTQIVDENVQSAYSGGGETGLNKGGPSSPLDFYTYDGGWRFNGDPGTASGDGSGGFTSDTSSDGSGGISDNSSISLNSSGQQTNARIIYNFFTARGWCKTAIAGLCGNIDWESGFNPNRHEDGGTGYGLVQWTPPENLTDVLNKLGLTERNSLQNQLQALYYEYINGGQWYSTYDFTKPYMTLRYNHTYAYWATDDSKDPGLAAQIFMACYERPNANKTHVDERAKAAWKWYRFFN